MLRYLLDKFWDKDIWLPPNTTWEDLAPGPDKPVVLNDHRHLLYPIPLAIVLIIIRHMLEKYWFAPFGKSLGIKNTRPKKAPSNPKLEAAYQASTKIRHKQGITNDIWWYYMISTAFYWSLTISQFWDVKRKDFWQMFVHHITTIALLSFSWVCNAHRIGTLVLLVHDCADILLDAAKATKYANYQKLCDMLFAVFTLLWIVTRLWIFPFYIIWSTSIRAPMLQPMFPAYYIFNSLLCLILGLHLVWTWLILQVAYKAITAGKLDGDIRSSSSELSDSSHQSNHSTPNRAHAHANSNAHAHTNSKAHAHVNHNKDK
ncbi:LAG1 longevity assurance-like 6 [Papilio machaon]|uniref:LAG1 longevity assurance-like 6 n=1 Tax=Papilio machaon TaxID=76193 RepID=A0A0N1I8W8_PAPMA|nr:LAG1 longevity assurance-like 6 [Papilio machaon]